VQAAAREAFRLFLRDPFMPALRVHELKKTHRGHHRDGSWSVTINRSYRAIFLPDAGTNVWYWIGSHSEYDQFTGRR
jgi:hypothetical protein